jgi:predicted patatin/cPLA2 family phospholipase
MVRDFSMRSQQNSVSPSRILWLDHPEDAGNVLYFAARQWESTKRIWTELLATPRFISRWRLWRIMNVDYLIDEVFKQQERLNLAALKLSPIDWYVPLSDFETGKTFYASARDNFDPFEILRAAKAVPFLFGKRVPLARRRYIDGELGPILQDHLDHVLQLGARNIVIVNHTAAWTRTNSMPVRLYSTLIARGMHDAIIRDISTDVKSFHATDAHIVFVSPTNLPCGSATHSKEKIRATFERGYNDALALESELRTLFGV